MRKTLLVVALVLFGMPFATGCGEDEGQADRKEYARASMFCDVDFWEHPVWDETPGTVMGDISEKTGLALDVMEPSQEAATWLKIKLLNDDLPDIISVTDFITISQLVDSGKVWRLDEFLEEYKPDSHLLEYFPEDIKDELIKRDGGWYALPSHLNSADARQHWEATPRFEALVNYNDNNAIIWNQALLERIGLKIEELQTEESVLAAFEKAKEAGLQVNGESVVVLLVDGKNYRDPTLKYLEGTFGAEWVDEKGDYKDILLQPQTKHAFAFLNSVVREGYALPEEFTMETSEVAELMQSGRVLCFVGNIANVRIDFREWVSSGVILSTDGSQPVLGKNLRASTGWISTFIAKDCENPKEVAEFIDYMTSEEGMTLWNFGYEGTDFYVGEDGLYYRILEKDENWETVKEEKGLEKWWMFGNTAWSRSVMGEEEIGANEEEDAAMTAYGRHEKTVIYDSSLLIIPADWITAESEEGKIEKAIEEWKLGQMIKVVLAADEAAFEREYDLFLHGLYDLGIEQLDERKNMAYQENCKEYGNSIPKVNPGTDSSSRAREAITVESYKAGEVEGE